MSITTYTNLQSSVADWLLRDDLTAVIPSFISLAEANLNRDARHWRMEDRSTATLDSQYSAVPADFLEPIRLSITSGTTSELQIVSQPDMVDLRARSANTSASDCGSLCMTARSLASSQMASERNLEALAFA